MSADPRQGAAIGGFRVGLTGAQGLYGITPAMLVALGEAGILTLEDLAGCATDDLTGWTERKQGETVKHQGAFNGLDVSEPEAEAVIMAARVKAGWIEPETVAPAATGDPAEQPLEEVEAE